jgi:A/G-specific adenine glycosylase
MNYLVISYITNNEEVVIVRKRTGNDIWKNMYDFPCIETLSTMETDQILEKAENQWLSGGIPYVVKKVSEEYIHQLSHRRIFARFIRIELSGIPNLAENFSAVRKDQIAELPLPRLIDRYLASQL